MIPSRIDTHTKQAKALLTTMFRDRKVVTGILAALINQIQKLEIATWEVLNGRTLDDSIGVQLDVIGAIVGEPRGGKLDAEYRGFIRLRILINRSKGRTPELIHIARVASMGRDYRYTEHYPAGFAIEYSGAVEGFRALAAATREAKPSGVERAMLYTSAPLVELFRPSNATTGLGGAGPCDSATLDPNHPVAHIEVI